MTDPHPLDRAREAYLLLHPEEATADDVREAMMSLRAMREAAREQAEANGGCAVIVTMFLRDESLRCGFTAPAMDDERIATVAARAMEIMAKSDAEPEELPPEPVSPLNGDLQVIAVGVDRDSMHQTIAGLPARGAFVLLAGNLDTAIGAAREAALLRGPVRMVPA